MLEKNGYYFLEGMPKTSPAAPGTAEPEKWGPYKLWSGDLWKCDSCGAQIVVGVGRGPIAEHYQENFAAMLDKFAPQVQVNDC